MLNIQTLGFGKFENTDLRILDAIFGNKSETLWKLAAFDENDNVVGVSSFRINERGVKRINTLAFIKRQGVGTALVKHICRTTQGYPQYSVNVPGAVPWVKAMGMTPGKILDDGRQEFTWSAEEAWAFGQIP